MINKKIASIKLNAIGNYFGQSYTILVTLLCTPLYIKYLGAESYGLVGFFIILQNWLNLLDMGLSATLCRQVSFARGQSNGFERFKHLLRSFEVIFVSISVLIICIIYFQSDWIAFKWIKAILLNPTSIAYCITIMGLIIGLRFFSTLYRGGIIGFEDQIWLNKTVVIITTLKYFGAILVLAFISNDIVLFFEYQLAIALLEAFILSRRFYFNLPPVAKNKKLFKIDWNLFHEVLPFSMSITYTTALQLAISQFDKLLLSGLLSLNIFGFFSVITIISSGVISLSIPIFTAFQPRITMLTAKKGIDEMISLYTDMTQIVTWIVFSTAMLILIFPQEILFLLTGDDETYKWGGEILQWYVLGSSLYVIGSCQYYLQNAFGKLKLYVIGMTISFLIQCPLIYLITTKYGAIGAAQLWFTFSLIWFLVFSLIVHNRFLPSFHFRWLLKDIIPILLSVVVFGLIINTNINIDINNSKLIILLKLFFIAVFLFGLSSLSVSIIRKAVLKKLIHSKV